MASRVISARYDDPLDLIWLRAAQRVGMRVERSRDTYASWDGDGTLSIAVNEHFDADDSLAQLIFHELCHALVAGPARKQRDWGLCNETERDLVFEHACHRVQAKLAQGYGLREFMAVTTEWRPYWDALPADPLAPCEDPARPIALEALERAEREPWRCAIHDALEATARVAAIVSELAATDSLWRKVRARHSTGFLLATNGEQRCGDCAWAFARSGGKVLRCRQSERAGLSARVVRADEVACERWEPALSGESCRECGACCREGFDLVEVGAREPFVKNHPELVQRSSLGVHVPRPEGRCVALQGDGTPAAPYLCKHYAERPRSCAQFPVAGAACLLARRRTGLSR